MDEEEGRRREVLRILAAGGLGIAGLSGFVSRALAAGDLPGGTGIARLEGQATINEKPARVGSAVALGDRIRTGPQSQAVVVLQGDAFLLRSETTITVQGPGGKLGELAIAAGRVLSVFSRKPVAIRAASATIGIRGTGAYIEVEPRSVYFCLCYGEAVIDGPRMQSKHVKTTHHETPLLLTEEGGIMKAQPGPFQNHSDAELVMLEALVGRKPPFLSDGQYPATRY